jgi:CheY-like chemotaxis protein
MKTNETMPARPHLIVVDDDEALLDITAQILREFTNADIVSFSNPREALRAFEAEPEYFDLVVTDLEMPGMDGLKLSRAIHAGSPKVKSILVTGSRRIISSEDARQAGFDTVLVKPYSIASLTDAVRHALTTDCPVDCPACEAGKPCVTRN